MLRNIGERMKGVRFFFMIFTPGAIFFACLSAYLHRYPMDEILLARWARLGYIRIGSPSIISDKGGKSYPWMHFTIS